MASIRLLRKSFVTLSGCGIFIWTIYTVVLLVQFQTVEIQKDSSITEDAVHSPRKEVNGIGDGAAARHVQGLHGDYEEVEYSSSVLQKADVDVIIKKEWTFNKSAADEARKDMFTYFNPYKIITMTSDDATGGLLQRFYRSKAIPMIDVPPGISRLLPAKQLFRHDPQYKTCALVGNSGILLNSSCGKSIDSNDFVIRCNFAEMNGFADDVGTKTNVLTFNPSIVDKKFNRLKSHFMRTEFLARMKRYGNYVLWLPVFSAHTLPINIRTVLNFYEKNAKHLKNVQLAFPGNILPEILDFWISRGVDEERISTGLLMYIIASTICDRIDLYGFYPFHEYKGKPIPYHYEDQIINTTITGSQFNSNYRRFHRLPDEFVYLKKMHSAGALKLNIGECES